MRLKRTASFTIIFSVIGVLLSGCGVHTDEINSAADGFLSAAKDGKVDELTDYATVDVLKDLGWDENTVDGYTDKLLSSLTESAGLDMDSLMEDESISSAVNSLVDTINNQQVLDYKLDTDSIEESDGLGVITAEVTVLTEQSITDGISNEELQGEIEQLVYDYMTQNIDSLADLIGTDDNTQMYSTILVAIMPDMINLLQEKMSSLEGEEQTWRLTCDEVDDKWIVTGVEVK